ncbi:long-chain fatty acid--CoA ligase [Nocardiopsis gilva YIM 90087]|uniref:Acyl-CoA synthetase n=1 Tax=Nocardiopsis gilva YIM 90087 TaxID=1235441 RepID=A0A223S6A2_9ACTN|nr:AMP-dependent synthetase/ligase [Nocardiopsis gilva]ASU83646.1 long-chain fatty acid--CoA ligase [Nocardiopsis gilva YIM 90087]
MEQTDVLRARQSVEAEIEGLTLVDLLHRTATEHGGLPALSDRVGDGWTTLTWSEYRQAARELAAAYLHTGVDPGDVVALMMPNRSEHLIADMGAVHAGAVPFSVYATFSAEQIEFVAADCAAKVAVLDGADELARWRPGLARLPHLRTVVLLDASAVPEIRADGEPEFVSWAEFTAAGRRAYAADPAAVDARTAAVTPESNATLLYTSGTTGNPKGVYETHHQVLYQVTITQRSAGLPHGAASLSYLSMAHIAERVLSAYLPMTVAGHIHFCPDVLRLGEFLGLVRPHGLFGVPRIWEKLQARLSAALAAAPGEQRTAIESAAEVARAYVEGGQYGRTRTPELEKRFARVDEEVLAPIRALIGLDRAEACIVGAAPMPVDTLRFFAGLGLLIRDVYGMTENCGAVTANRHDAYRFGSVGRPQDGIELSTTDDGELLVRGPVNVGGYLDRPEESAALIDADGWLHTGDIGHIDEDGFVYVVDRKKELIITSGGENIAPATIENRLKEHPLIGQALAYGDRRPYPVALLTLDPDIAPGWAADQGVDAADLAALATHPRVLEEVGRAVEEANGKLARVQQVKKWRLLPAEWTVETEELTPSLKLKRRVIQRKYSDDLGRLYSA